ncbi:hypothetical protein CTI12_AA420760 [Artemisia annua]|uniref:Transketolase N-terminal domain-containing protein n=1 Tax=Artemisia annua TaxID=35608 RepID=A0A2U1LHM1_ARTAN|nr:hypothetical protein CTI12_AA420760 [Artemisia annua]
MGRCNPRFYYKDHQGARCDYEMRFGRPKGLGDWSSSGHIREENLSSKPTLIKVTITFHFGLPNKASSYSVHESALGAKEVDATRQNPYEPFHDMAGVLLPFLKYFIGGSLCKGPKILNFIVRSPWNTLDIVGQVKQPILFLSGQRDEMIPPLHMQILYAKAAAHNKCCTFVEFPTGMHVDTWIVDGDHSWKTVQTFLQQIFSEKKAGESHPESNATNCFLTLICSTHVDCSFRFCNIMTNFNRSNGKHGNSTTNGLIITTHFLPLTLQCQKWIVIAVKSSLVFILNKFLGGKYLWFTNFRYLLLPCQHRIRKMRLPFCAQKMFTIANLLILK